ncbi:methionine ABC transporter ATP-binding protein [Mammaliicoccus vitulinus]|uniref:methionine ABC transporter ATP-binding protein n=1 Tax=Mammaliicoccus vitulinus TaxID=71237 RepID=UPI000D1D15CF|nr:methionine ABC transporter ATP-binding protein [Mammaliicoccus vitulinus]MBM6630014.1 methionine ABC transporter ATP-binding protein [Mammaliicoccus vitulinus]MBO3076426.1 methionine ABC transporter ATP-binding protein [Mammaliicoccus vitulinus]PTI88694.1 methionine ABC transporter ATP-binding protein [Mammaliicoccus vitulinus]QJF24552.1 methionine ABC transporter ATP-binding protein [Mammaliicoccus vitulinus]QQT15645.1 methionine ABC transporter ATP-binding protein [Mammaliicoccus vitulinu
MIELNKVVKTFKTKKGDITAVDHVDLNIDKGSIYGVIGFSGAGKSTLIRMFNGLETPTEGEVIVDGANIGKLSKRDLRQKRQKVSMIFQHFNLLWSRTVKDNIAFPLEIAGVSKSEINEKTKALIKRVGLEGRENAYPSQLSGGQKQRVGIARALANDPHVLLCDEATSALDPQTTDEILDLLVDINKEMNLTIILITHEMHVIRKICDHVAVMENGKFVEEGEVISVFNNPQTYVTQRFVKDDLKADDLQRTLADFRAEQPNGEIWKLNFVGGTSANPVLAKIIKKYNVDINVIEGDVKLTQNGTFGHMIVHLPQGDYSKDQIKKELNDLGVKVEVNVSE